MMHIYKISDQTFETFPQIVTYNKKLCQLPRFFEIPDFGKIELNNEAVMTIYELKGKKVTDLISSAMYSFSMIINEKFKNLLNGLNSSDFQFIPINITKKNESIGNYYLFHFIKSRSFFDQMVDWENSIFKVQQRTAEINHTEYVEFKNFDEYEKFDFDQIYYKQLEFNPHFKLKSINDHALFSFNYKFFPIGFFCTDEVKKMIEKECITGIEFEEVTDFEY